MRVLADILARYEQLCDQLVERADRLWLRCVTGLYTIFHSELKMVGDPEERLAIIMAASMPLPEANPKPASFMWWLTGLSLLASVPAFGAYVAAMRLGLPARWCEVALLVGGGMGFVAAIAALLLIGRKEQRRRHLELLPFADHPACPDCGYDLRGHRDRHSATMPDCICPECGRRIDWPVSEDVRATPECRT